MPQNNFPEGTAVKLKPAPASAWPEYGGLTGNTLAYPCIEHLDSTHEREWYHVRWPSGKINCWLKEDLKSA